ncbi:MAG: hypothetical protein HOK80_09215 [Candidatus Cloacimonetes bacterium]|jgi:hypothetical protein|nr:hypothetical protein [Candidatus Cloacimonadota bacterium]
MGRVKERMMDREGEDFYPEMSDIEYLEVVLDFYDNIINKIEDLISLIPAPLRKNVSRKEFMKPERHTANICIPKSKPLDLS